VAPGAGSVRSVAAAIPYAAGIGKLLARAGRSGAARIASRLEEMREILRAADLLISPSRFLCDRMAALGISGIDVLPYGHAPFAVRRTPEAHGRIRFGFLGAAIPSKGVHVLAEAFRRLDDPRALLQIHGPFVPYHGDTEYEARVRRTLGPHANASLCGAFGHERIADVLGGLDVLVVPSLWEENAPLVVSEAFLARVPLLVSDHGGLAEMVRDGEDGLRFPPGDSAALARAMRRLLDEPQLRARLAATPPHVPTLSEHVDALEERYARARERYATRVGRVGVVIVDKSRPESAAAAARSAIDATIRARVLVVENGPGPEPPVPPGVEVLRLAENRGYAGGMNAGIRRLLGAGCDRLLLLNNDALVEPGCLRRLAEALEEPQLAAVGPVVLRETDGRVESRGARFDPRWGRQRLAGFGERAEVLEGRRSVPSLTGAALMLSATALARVGPLDEEYFHSFEDTDWSLRARAAGFQLAVVLGAFVRHAGASTLGLGSPERLYYAARNHVRAAERLLPLHGAARWARRLSILALNLGHAVAQAEVPRAAGLRAVLLGTSDSWRGRFGPRTS
jgi:GT2 family glycosyltransferase/glycosyltransferase involved in cell wall biosynthesis